MKRLNSLLALILVIISSNAYSTPMEQLQKALQQHKGEVVYLDFWASWCKPCRKSFPWLNDVSRKYAHRGFKVIGINVDSDTQSALNFLNQVPADFDVIYDPDGEIAEHFNIQGMPSGLLFSKDGQFKDAHIGFYENKTRQYELKIQSLLR